MCATKTLAGKIMAKKNVPVGASPVIQSPAYELAIKPRLKVGGRR